MKASRDPKELTEPEALEKLRHFCAYQERSRNQVIRKMKNLGLPEEAQERILRILEEENFLNQNRFAVQYARGKSRMKGWGPKKIESHLKYELGNDFNQTLVSEATDLNSALEKLRKDLNKKNKSLQEKRDPEYKSKLIRFCLGRGFDLEASLKVIRDLTT
jgi:regulatory protein